MTILDGTFAAESEALAGQVLESLVVIEQERKGRLGRFFAGAGAGIIWSSDGQVLTNNHVVGRRGLTVTLHDGRRFPGRVLARDEGFDLALLEIPASGLRQLPLANDRIRVGMLVFAFGHPFGQRNTVTRGVVSGMLRAHIRGKGRGLSDSFPILRTDATLAPGNSGGPLVNARGELVGINAMIMGGDQSLAIPISTIREFADRLGGGMGQSSQDFETKRPEGIL
jgi:serine protease Do